MARKTFETAKEQQRKTRKNCPEQPAGKETDRRYSTDSPRASVGVLNSPETFSEGPYLLHPSAELSARGG